MDPLGKTKIILFRNRLRFFGIALYRFQTEIDDLPDGILGQVKAINGKVIPVITIARQLLDRRSEEVAFVLLHELFHILLHHLLRPLDRDPLLWQLAADHVTNSFLMTIPEILAPSNIIFFRELQKIKNHMTVEEAYEHLQKMVEDNKIRIKDNGFFILVTLPDNKKAAVPKDIPQYPQDAEAMKRQVDSIKRQLSAEIESLKSRGMTAGGYYEIIKQILAVEVPWDKILENAIGAVRVPAQDTRSWANPNKFLNHIALVPGMDWTVKPQDLVVCVDTSGSISTKELMAFAGVITASMKHFNRVRLITHDTKVHQDEIFEEESQFMNFLSETGFMGRGGTSHKDVLERLQENQNSDISLVIFLTDLYSDLEPNDPLLQNLPYIIVTTKNYNKNAGFEPIVIDSR